MFRVVQDQLRVSEGWVRCGRCDTVFNALDALVDLEAEAAAAAGAGTAVNRAPSDAGFYDAPGALDDVREDGPYRAPAADPDDGRVPDWPSPSPPVTRGSAEAVPPAGAASAARLPPVLASAPPPAGLDDAPQPAAEAPVWRPSRDEVPPPKAADVPMPDWAVGAPFPAAATSSTPTPSFMQGGDRSSTRPTSPAMRVAWVGAALILTGLLAAQLVYHFRDVVAARSATADAWLRSACARWGCRIEPPRRIDQVTLEGSGLARVADAAQAVKLSINLRNRAQTDLLLPSVDLSLTDAKGELIARRVLAPADFQIDPPRIRRGAELPLELVLSTGERAIAGYTVELFYP